MNDPFRNYDAWLEAPFQRACADADAYVEWCETHDVDPDAISSRDAYDALLTDDGRF